MVLAAERKLVKAYPHSLLEALACGRVVKGVSRPDLLRGIQEVKADYGRLQENARGVAQSEFSQERLVNAYRQRDRTPAR